MTKRVLEFLYHWPSTRLGGAVERVCIGCTGHSLVNWLAARLSGGTYYRPLLLTTVGARSGRHRSVVLPFYPATDDDLVVIGSKGGGPSDPHWVHNLRAHPDAWIRRAGRRQPVRARISTGEERARLWEEITSHARLYLDYQRQAEAHREIPVVVLTPR